MVTERPMQIVELERHYRLKRAADLIDYTVPGVRELIRKGLLRCRKPAGAVLIAESEIRRFLEG